LERRFFVFWKVCQVWTMLATNFTFRKESPLPSLTPYSLNSDGIPRSWEGMCLQIYVSSLNHIGSNFIFTFLIKCCLFPPSLPLH